MLIEVATAVCDRFQSAGRPVALVTLQRGRYVVNRQRYNCRHPNENARPQLPVNFDVHQLQNVGGAAIPRYVEHRRCVAE